MLLAAMVGFAIITVIFVVTVSGTQGNPPLGADSLRHLVAAPSRVISGGGPAGGHPGLER
jgi:hypothetical protein